MMAVMGLLLRSIKQILCLLSLAKITHETTADVLSKDQ